MVLGRTDANNVVLLPDRLLMQQQVDMNLFVITEYDMVNMSHHEEGIMMVIKFRRKIMSEMMTTYLPSILLMMITYATTFFKPIFFEAALSVNLTTMLVMTTIFISKMESLPPTSDIKMLDFWLIFCQIIPFAEVVLLTAMEYKREDNNDVPLNPSRVNVLPIRKDDIQTEAKTTYQKIKLILFVPKLKTLGKFKVAPPSKSSFFRKDIASIADIDSVCDLFWSCCLCRLCPALT